MKMRRFPKSILPVAISTFISMTGHATSHQSIGAPLQESSCGDRFSCNPPRIGQTAATTFLERTGTDSVEYLHEIACSGEKARILEDTPVAPTGFNIKAQSGDELVYNARCRHQ